MEAEAIETSDNGRLPHQRTPSMQITLPNRPITAVNTWKHTAKRNITHFPWISRFLGM